MNMLKKISLYFLIILSFSLWIALSNLLAGVLVFIGLILISVNLSSYRNKKNR